MSRRFIGLPPTNSVALTGTPTAPTPAALNNSTRIATTAYVDTIIPNMQGLWLVTDGGIPVENTTSGVVDATPNQGIAILATYSKRASIVNFYFTVSTGGTGGNPLMDIGIYSLAGTLLCHTGATAGTLGNKAIASTNVGAFNGELEPGSYYIACTVNDATIQCAGHNINRAATVLGIGTTKFAGTLSVATSGGALNNALGTITTGAIAVFPMTFASSV